MSEKIEMHENRVKTIHDRAIVESGVQLGEGTCVWANAHILPGAKLGNDCNICDGVFIENKVTLGDRVTIKCGVQLWDGIEVEDDVFIGPNATFTNDPFPRSKQHLEKHPITKVSRGASIGANCTILPGITIGTNAMVGAGAVVIKDVPPNAIVVGNPAQIVGYVDTEKHDLKDDYTATSQPDKTRIEETNVDGVKIFRFPIVRDVRGNLSVGNFINEIPFQPKRFFTVFDVPSKEIRGEHAHKECEQFIMCMAGSVHVYVDDGENKREFILNQSNIGIYIPPLVWAAQYHYSPDAMLFVFASDYYDANDYIRNYDEYIQNKISY